MALQGYKMVAVKPRDNWAVCDVEQGGPITGACLKADAALYACRPEDDTLLLVLSIMLPILALCLLVLLCYCLCCRRVTKLFRAYSSVKKRVSGKPTSGSVSVVVTDIEGYSGVWGVPGGWSLGCDVSKGMRAWL